MIIRMYEWTGRHVGRLNVRLEQFDRIIDYS
jgi:hypothetical protein